MYHAAGIADAMARIRSELGPDALILATRRVAGGVEVTAALESDDEAPRAPPDRLAARALAYHAVPEKLRRHIEQGNLESRLAAMFRFAAVALTRHGRPLLIAGPPGAGKTLTAARLATRLVMRGVLPLVISADGQRAGGADQLAAFTRLLGLSRVIADHPEKLRSALARREEGAPVIVDLPGSNPFNAGELDELQSCANAANGSIAIVLAAGTDPSEAADLAAAYRQAGAAQLVATRLDLARRIGGVLAAAATGLAMIEAGIGPGAADGLAPITPALLARRLLLVPPDARLERPA